MIDFYFEEVDVDFDKTKLTSWIQSVIVSEKKNEGDITFIFCTDEYLLKMNQEFLNHDTYTDVISFDNTIGNELNGDIFISTERVLENSSEYNVTFLEELRRVIIHGVLHFCGYKDKTKEDILIMRQKENDKLSMFHVEHR